MDVAALDAADEVGARGDVAPLVAAADLQGAAVAAVQLQVVVGLQDLVAELGVAEPFALQPRGHRLPGEHAVDREVLADVAQEVDGAQLAGPVEVADETGRVGLGVEVEKSADLAAQAVHPLGDDVAGVERALGVAAARVADEAGGAADEADRVVPGQLEATQREQRHEVADVQGRRGGVETGIDRDRCLGHGRAQRVEVGGLGDQASPREVVKDVGHGDLASLGRCRCL